MAAVYEQAPDGQTARTLLLRASCVSSTSPSSSSNGGRYMPNRPRYPLRRPYHPPTGFDSSRPHASTVPSAAGFCSSAAPSGTQSPWARSHATRSSVALRWYFSWVEPTWHTSAGGSADSSRYIVYALVPGAVLSCHGSSFVPLPAMSVLL